ncbi:MAG TPA: methyltransferase domain-containing protein [Pyrinomonadaceae bacterium]|jgi:2-polyprenyl-3-methyl-5-hydroxy-6-metoxy-1,4-benzoquinol methylase|nr:methyltransferase domain-containing protein [Pyrinomonadaceae bacterium]
MSNSAPELRGSELIKADIPAEGFESASVRERLYGRYRSNQDHIEPEDERRQRAPYLRHLISTHFPKDKSTRILDLGCGNGTLLHFLRESGFNSISGVDNSPEQTEQAKLLGLTQVRHADVSAFLASEASESYDVITALDIIEHLTKVELLDLADEVYRTLAPGGRWIIHAPNAEGFMGSRIRYADLTHEQAFTPASISQLARAAGFRSWECYEDAPIAHGVKSSSRLLVWKCARGFLRLLFMAETGDTGGNAIFSQNLLAVVRK